MTRSLIIVTVALLIGAGIATAYHNAAIRSDDETAAAAVKRGGLDAKAAESVMEFRQR